MDPLSTEMSVIEPLNLEHRLVQDDTPIQIESQHILLSAQEPKTKSKTKSKKNKFLSSRKP